MRWFSLFQFIGSFLLCVAILKKEELDILSKLDVWKKLKAKRQLDGSSDNFYDWINNLTHGEMFNMSYEAHRLLERQGHHWPPTHEEIPQFNCIIDNKPHKKARSVHELTPYDVEIIGAFGDSLTAAFGALAYTPIDLFIEYHGVSWSIGGDKRVDQVITLPNIIKEYSPGLQGYATGISPPEIPIPSENLDVAVSGATSYGLMDQAKRFIGKMLINPKYDFFGSWKVLTLFIGGNDLCSCCRKHNNDVEKYKPENFANKVTEVLDYLHERVPKLFVNLVTPPNVTILQDLASPWCDFTHLIECKCGTIYGESARKFTNQVLEQYHTLYQQLLSSGRYDTRDDFTVVLQPFFDKTIIPRLKDNKTIDRSYFAPDCFHFSGKSHQASALALWNSMLEPVGHKSQIWEPHEKFHCPSKDHPYFYTAKNSKKQHPSNQQQQQQKQQKGGYFWSDPFFSSLMFVIVILLTYYIIKRVPKRNTLPVLAQYSPPQGTFFDPSLKEMKVPL